MKALNTIFNNFKGIFTKNNQKISLGRWNIDNCHHKINKKIDYSNEDHCGPCGQYDIKSPLELKKSLLDENIVKNKIGDKNKNI